MGKFNGNLVGVSCKINPKTDPESPLGGVLGRLGGLPARPGALWGPLGGLEAVLGRPEALPGRSWGTGGGLEAS